MAATEKVRDQLSTAEYERRWRRVREELAGHGMDALAVTTRTHIQFLTGHDGAGAYAAPYFLLVRAEAEPPPFIVRRYDETNIRNDLRIAVDLETYFGRADAVETFARRLRALGLGSARLGLELDWWGLAPADVRRLEAALPDLTIVDGSAAVSAVAEIHSEEEIAVMRRAAELTDVAIDAFWDSVAEGITETQAVRAIEEAVTAAGGEGFEGRPFTLLFGGRTALPHGYATDNALGRGDVAFTEVSGFCEGFAAGVCRTAVLGRHPRAEELHAIAEEATDATIEALRPGAIAHDVHAAAFDVVKRAGREDTMLQRAGYAIGLEWYDRGYMSLEPEADGVVTTGMTFHIPRILFDESGEFGVGTSDTVLVTDGGPEVLSRRSRSLKLV
jgi:Xaa-Pro aminopeptidase